jgi:hypothetical protein
VGTGLGLWVTRQLLEKCGGSVRLRSRTGSVRHGTTFVVDLPVDSPLKTGSGETRVDVSRNHGVQVDATARERQPGIKF